MMMKQSYKIINLIVQVQNNSVELFLRKIYNLPNTVKFNSNIELL